MRGRPVSRNGDLAAGTAELQSAGETGKAAADDDDVIHDDGLRAVDGGAPAFGKARNIRHLINHAIAEDQAAPPNAFAIASEDGEIVDGAGDTFGPGTDQPDRGIARQLLPRLCQDDQRWLVIVAEQPMRVAGEAVARQAGIENGDLAAGTAELQGAGETGKAAADDDDVIHGDKLRVVDGLGLACAFGILHGTVIRELGYRQGLKLS